MEKCVRCLGFGDDSDYYGEACSDCLGSGKKSITEFQGEHRWLSNFWPTESPIHYLVMNGIVTFSNVEAAYQSMKYCEMNTIRKFQLMTGREAKLYSKNHKFTRNLRPSDLLEIMEGFLRQKFSEENPTLRQKLIDTGDIEIIEGNRWGDTFWGVDIHNRVGQNNLGKLIMKIREEIVNGTN